MNKAEFIEAYGHRFSRCNIPQEHNEHLWESPAYLSPANPPDELWWCSGERIDFEEFTGFKRAVSKHDPEPVRDGLLESLRAAAKQRQVEEAREALRARLNRPDRPTSSKFIEDIEHQIQERRDRWQKDGEIYVAAMGTPEPERPDVDASAPAREHLAQEFPETQPHTMTGIEAAEAIRSAEAEFCPTCKSTDPAKHPSTQPDGGEVNLCRDVWHDVDPRTRELRDKLEIGEAVTNKLVRWADRAMFKAEPMPEGGPRVYLLWMTPDPLGAIAAACKMYKGEVVRDLSAVTDAERLEYLAQVQKTKLKAPFEFVKFHFLIEGVTRSFTHQMVRQRTAVYAQESLRFAVKGGEEQIPVGLPPSLAGTDDWDAAQFQTDIPMTTEEKMRQAWEDTVSYIDEQYAHLIDLGMPAEDARGLLPHNTLTRLHYSTDLRALLDHAGNRLCTQAQFEWRLVFAKLVEAIRNVDINPNDAEGHNVLESNGTSRVYMAYKLAEMFKPVCYQTGKCEFKANFDRACSIRSRVDANEAAGRPSSEWGKAMLAKYPGEHGSQDPMTPIVEAIKPGEWLLDPGAAREKK